MDQLDPARPTYLLEQKILAPRRQLAITESEFLALKEARSLLSEAHEFEQRYELLIGNFIELEISLTELCLRWTIQPQYEYHDSAWIIQEANRHVGNLLTAAKGYIDQVKQDFAALPLAPAFIDSVEQLLSAEYDASIEYRFMEALRNHTQHRASPVTRFSGSAILEDHEANGWVESITIWALKAELFENKKFKRKFLDDLPEKVDLRFYCREYVRHLGIVHVALRELIQPAVVKARLLFDDAIKRYEDNGANDSIGLCARRSGEKSEEIPIFTNWDDVRAGLARKNARPADLWPRQRSGELSGASLHELRTKAGHTIDQAARLSFTSPARWQQYEGGLRIPGNVDLLYRLQTGQHTTHELTRRSEPPVAPKVSRPDGEVDAK